MVRTLALLVLLTSPSAPAQETLLQGPLRPGLQSFPITATLRVKAGTVLTVEPGATDIKIRASRIIFEPGVVIRGMGAPGTRGADAGPRSDEWVSSTEYATEAPQQAPASYLKGHSEWEAAGSETDRGAQGHPGGPGGPGPVVEFIADRIEGVPDVIVELPGGPGGPGGKGGRGRPLRCSVHPDEVKYGPTGPDGEPGSQGPDGWVIFTAQEKTVTEDRPDPVAFALTISGGISLGSYEAGYNWALVRYLKRRSQFSGHARQGRPLDLVAVTGASAGSINTLLTAISWCQQPALDQQETATDNIFYDTWIPIGLTELVPADPSRYAPTDAVLSRAGFEKAQQRVRQALHGPGRFRPGCKLPVGMNVTRSDPQFIRGSDLEAPMDRFSVALEARATADHLTFHDSRLEDESGFVRPYLHLTDTTRPASSGPDAPPVPEEDLMNVLRASSAFPVAFGLQELEYFTYDPKDPTRLARARPARFWDGGLYDNLPVGLALSFVRKPLFGAPRPAGPFQLFAVDPDRRRQYGDAESSAMASAGPERKGLGNLTKIAGNFLSVARKYELQSFIRYALPDLNASCHPSSEPTAAAAAAAVEAASSPYGQCNALVSSRFYPVFGERLGAFGAFVLRAFREVDFGAGVYDALFQTAERECSAELSSGAAGSLEPCIVSRVRRGYLELRLDDPRSIVASSVVKRLLREELAAMVGPYGDPEAVLDAMPRFTSPDGAVDVSARAWLDDRAGEPAYVEALMEDSRRIFLQGRPDPLDRELDHIQLLGVRLRADERLSQSLPPEDQGVVTHQDWFTANAMRVLRRAEVVEQQDRYPIGESVTRSAVFLARTGQSLHRLGLDLDPSSVDDDWGHGGGLWHFAPYHLDFSTSTLQLGWRPTFGFTGFLAAGLPLAVSYWFPEAARPWEVSAHAGLALVLRPRDWMLSAIELTPARLTLGLHPLAPGQPARAGTALGFEAAGYFLAGKLRVSAQFLRWGSIADSPLYVTVGVADFNGILFHWLR